MHSKKAMEYERFGNCLTNARQKSRYVFGQNLTDLDYMDRHYSLLTTFMPGNTVFSVRCQPWIKLFCNLSNYKNNR